MMMGSCALLSAGIVAVTLKEPQRGAKEEDLKEVLSKGKPLQNVDVSLPVSLSLRLSLFHFLCLCLCLCVFCLCGVITAMLMYISSILHMPY